jgi:hypothetical protein
MAKTSLHQYYKTTDGIRVPSVTTIIGTNLGWNKGALMGWVKKMMREGKDPDKVRDQAADIGTITHGMIEAHIKGESFPTEEYAPVDVEKALSGYQAYLDWENQHNVDPVASELGLVSEKYRYGGTLDFIAYVDNIVSLVDFKTSNGLYVDHRIQLAAYLWLYEETHGGVQLFPHLLQLDKNDGSFHHHQFPQGLEKEWQAFLHLLALHTLKSELGA